MSWITNQPIAHRGLHDASRGIIENSPSAFEAAVRGGYAIELDIVLSSDGDAMVFHDKTLDRVTRESGKVTDRTADELSQILLDGSADTIPTFADVLAQVAGRTPLLIELKNQSRTIGPMESRVAELLSGYTGEFAVQSFNPFSMGWFAKEHPAVLRGQISQNYFQDEDQAQMPAHQKFLLTNLLLNGISKPNFVAYDNNALPAFPVSLAKSMGLPILSWTVRDQETAARVAPHVDNIIFEGFIPADANG